MLFQFIIQCQFKGILVGEALPDDLILRSIPLLTPTFNYLPCFVVFIVLIVEIILFIGLLFIICLPLLECTS